MTLLVVEDLTVSVPVGRSRARVVENVGFEVEAGETVGLVGESGSGKSMTALAIMGLLPAGARRESGRVLFEGTDLANLPPARMRSLRASGLSMIFQEPMTSLNPLLRAGIQIAEVLEVHLGMARAAALTRAVDLMRSVGFPDPERQVRAYPHELSGGMRQRVMIAMAIAAGPRLLIADEPTTALDVTIQAQVLRLIADLSRARGMGTLLITHDLGVIAGMADRVVVMYAGEVVERASKRALFVGPRHPYTRRLMRSVPRVAVKLPQLEQILGSTPPAGRLPAGCRFHPRCADAIAACSAARPALTSGPGDRAVRCLRADDPELIS
jgi:oligopeptide/dipeptide ABC transporter ATP-binding protein